MMSEKDKLVFLHIPKCAGSSVRREIFNRMSDHSRICEFRFESEFISYGIDKAARDFDCFSAHVGFDAAARLGGPIVTVLRNPIERINSLYNFWHRRKPKHDLKGVFEYVGGLTLHGFLETKDSRVAMGRDNSMTYMLAGGNTLPKRQQLARLGDYELLDKAFANLQRCAVVGFVENMSGFEEALSGLLGVRFEIGVANKTRRCDELNLEDAGMRALLFDACYLDIQLYMRALVHFGLTGSKRQPALASLS